MLAGGTPSRGEGPPANYRRAVNAEATDRFRSLLAGPEAEIPLDEAALLIAAHSDAGESVAERLARIDQLAAGIDAATAGDLGHVLFVERAIVGNTTDYGDPRNSFLHLVIERRLGIPISMSVLMIEVGRRLGVGLYGVGMPGHFIVGVDAESGSYVDPFHGGQRLDRSGCKALFARTQGGDAAFRSEYLARVGTRVILLRMLNNLLQSYSQRRTADAAWVARLRLCFAELPTAERRHSAEILGSFGAFGEAAAALEALATDVGGTRAPKLRARARELRARAN